ncbi:hypothetical protein PCE1_002976 [Barthelona sp. PCE]
MGEKPSRTRTSSNTDRRKSTRIEPRNRFKDLEGRKNRPSSGSKPPLTETNEIKNENGEIIQYQKYTPKKKKMRFKGQSDRDIHEEMRLELSKKRFLSPHERRIMQDDYEYKSKRDVKIEIPLVHQTLPTWDKSHRKPVEKPPKPLYEVGMPLTVVTKDTYPYKHFIQPKVEKLAYQAAVWLDEAPFRVFITNRGIYFIDARKDRLRFVMDFLCIEHIIKDDEQVLPVIIVYRLPAKDGVPKHVKSKFHRINVKWRDEMMASTTDFCLCQVRMDFETPRKAKTFYHTLNFLLQAHRENSYLNILPQSREPNRPLFIATVMQYSEKQHKKKIRSLVIATRGIYLMTLNGAFSEPSRLKQRVLWSDLERYETFENDGKIEMYLPYSYDLNHSDRLSMRLVNKNPLRFQFLHDFDHTV